MTDTHKRAAPRVREVQGYLLLLGWLSVVLAMGCDKQADPRLASQLQPMAVLPELDVKPVPWTISNRARLLRDDASKALAAGDCAAAAALSVESVTLDPSLTEARLDLVRIFATCGVPTTALALLGQMASATDHCAGCREAILASKSDKTLAPLWKSSRGQEVSKLVSDTSLPVEQWAVAVRDDLIRGKADALSTLIHPDEPWQLIRSCPNCADKSRRTAEKRRFFGFVIAQKLATRFKPDGAAHGAIPLKAVGAPKCSGRCCQWPVTGEVAIDTAALTLLCFRPITPKQGALTRLELVYGKPDSDVDAEKKRPSEDPTAGRHRVVHLAAPTTQTGR